MISLKRMIRCLLYLLVVLSFFAMPGESHADKSYRIVGVNISAKLHADGTMSVTETRTFRFKGSYKYTFRTIPMDGPVKFRDFRVSENGQEYILNDSKEQGTYQIRPKDGEVEIRWYFRAKNTERTFQFHYEVDDAVIRHEDVAVLYFQFISSDWRKSQRNVQVTVLPPEYDTVPDVRAWLHGPLWGVIQIDAGGKITAGIEHMPGRQYFEIRAVYPPHLFSDVTPVQGIVLPTILEEEAAWAEEANRQRILYREREAARIKRWEWGRYVVAGLALLAIWAWIYLFQRFGRRPEIPSLPDMSSDIPARTPPALVSYLLWDRQVAGGALMGTLFDLAKRQFLKIRFEEKEKKVLGMKNKEKVATWELDRACWTQNANELSDYENDLLKFLFNELAEGKESLDTKTIQKKHGKFTKFISSWQKTVKEVGKEKGWFDPDGFKGMYWSLGLMGVMILLTVPAAFLFGPWAAVLGGMGILLLIGSLIMPHWTREGAMEAKQWKALKKYLKTMRSGSHDSSAILHHIDDYLIYGIVLGVDKKILKAMAMAMPADRMNHYLPWIVYHGHTTGAMTPDAFATAMSSMIASTTATMSSAAGVGGGAAAGGGAGAGSGGGGAG